MCFALQAEQLSDGHLLAISPPQIAAQQQQAVLSPTSSARISSAAMDGFTRGFTDKMNSMLAAASSSLRQAPGKEKDRAQLAKEATARYGT